MKSDVLSLTSSNEMIIAGCRNGQVYLYDIRQFNQKGILQQSSAICNILPLNSYYLIISSMQHQIQLWDLRFITKSKPILSFHGHVNEYAQHIDMTLNDTQSILIASGQDKYIRFWNINNGKQLDSLLLGPFNDIPISLCWNNLLTSKSSLYGLCIAERNTLYWCSSNK
jgi:WD40 repeat protein